MERARVRVGAGAMGSIGVDADMPRDDPTPIFFDLTMVGVVSIHLLAAEG